MNVRELAELIDTHGATLVLLARSWCSTPEDVVQEAFYKLAQQKVWPDDPLAWLFRVVRNGAIDAGKAEQRRTKRESAVAKSETWFEEHEIDGLEAREAISALQTLPIEQREVVISRLWGGMNFEQIASVYGCSVSSAHRRYEAALVALREKLGEICPKK